MGWDVKATADSLAEAMPQMPTIPQDLTLSQAANWIVMALLVFAIATALVKLVPKLWAVIEETLFSNWRLALLGSSAFLLSVAGAWTTWDGMRNFTGEPVLSAMFTFGIHGVMLIVAWLIGESFATGMNQVRGRGGRAVSGPMVALTLLGGALLFAAATFALVRSGLTGDQLMYAASGLGAVLLSIALLMMFSKSDVIEPYTQGLRIIAKNSMLWVMFFACMATSVFFSFDSRFNVIFPKDQRDRAAEIRTKKQVASVVSDIGEVIATRRNEEINALFASEGWKAYDAELDALSKASEGAESEIEAHFTRQMEAQRTAIAEQQERAATATSGQAGLVSKKTILTDELSRLKADRPALAAELAQKKTELDNRAKEVDAKRVEAMAEDKGVEGTGKEGKGPIYRERMSELGKLKDYYKIGEERVRDAEKRMSSVDTRITAIERELAGIDGELAKLQGEAETAKQRITAAESSQAGAEGPKVDPARVRAAFERARVDFRQEPDVEKLTSLHQHCGQLYDAMIAADATKERVRNIDCDPKQASEAAAVMFGLNTGKKAYDANCAGGDKVPAGGVDALLGFGRKCLQDSGLPSKEATEMAALLSAIDLNRDDKAHNFVVSLNAFEDGNRLAYLALAIAIGIDSLIFMAGLFGANAVRSPLSDVPSLKARNSQQLNAMIETALLPDTFRKARLVTQSMHPIENTDGYSNEVRLGELDPETAVQVREVLNAGSIIGAVRRGAAPGQYLVRSELLEFLNTVIKRELEVNTTVARRGMELDQIEDQMTVALLPNVGVNCDAVLQSLDPIDEFNGFTSEVYLDRLADEVRPPMLNVLNTGATFQVVQRDKKDAERYFLHKDLYKILARIRARSLASDGAPHALEGPRAPRVGGAVREQRTPIAYHAPAAAAAAHVPPPLPETPVADSKSYFLTTLVTALGLSPDVFQDITGPTFSAAIQAGEAFNHARRANRVLDDELNEREEQAHNALELAYDRLKSEIAANDTWHLQQLDDAWAEVEQSWPVLMLLPNGPYETVLRSVVDQLEPDSGAGALPAEDAALLAAAKRLSEALGTNARGTDKDWMQLEHMFHQAIRAQGAGQPVAAVAAKRTLN